MIDQAKLKACNTVGELTDLLNSLTIEDLQDYLDAVEPARSYVELTMRDEHILKAIRATYDQLVGNIKDPVR